MSFRPKMEGTLQIVLILCISLHVCHSWGGVASVWSFRKNLPPSKLSKDLGDNLPQKSLPRSMITECGEDRIQVVVKRDIFLTGQLIQDTDIFLGSCRPLPRGDLTNMLLFDAHLQDCGSRVEMSEEEIVYIFALVYNPSPLPNSPIVRTNSAVIPIECHYQRKHYVSSSALKPVWVPIQTTMSSENILDFSLKLMTDDWQTQRPSRVFHLGEMLHIEASVNQYNHEPLRLFVDRCEASPSPDVASSPRYQFIGNRGCFTDGSVTGSRSAFVAPRQQENKLQINLDSFKFHGESTSSMYIICYLRGTFASKAMDHENKACFFELETSRWVSVDGESLLCDCCASGGCEACPPSKRGRRAVKRAFGTVQHFEAKTWLGPIHILSEAEDFLSLKFQQGSKL